MNVCQGVQLKQEFMPFNGTVLTGILGSLITVVAT